MPYKLNGRNTYEMNILSMNGRGYIMQTDLQKILNIENSTKKTCET